jgi:hypothetical protein
MTVDCLLPQNYALLKVQGEYRIFYFPRTGANTTDAHIYILSTMIELTNNLMRSFLEDDYVDVGIKNISKTANGLSIRLLSWNHVFALSLLRIPYDCGMVRFLGIIVDGWNENL